MIFVEGFEKSVLRTQKSPMGFFSKPRYKGSLVIIKLLNFFNKISKSIEDKILFIDKTTK